MVSGGDASREALRAGLLEHFDSGAAMGPDAITNLINVVNAKARPTPDPSTQPTMSGCLTLESLLSVLLLVSCPVVELIICYCG